MTKASELRVLNEEELYTRLAEQKQELFRMRFEIVTGQLQNNSRITQVRRDVARISGILREREIEAAELLETESAK
jgi:large subunit ribosomal protein L29